jgi:thymidylate kinase
MKLIIFEGLDRCGKDSHIAELTKNLRNYSVRHWSFPKGDTNEEKTSYQKQSFFEEFSHYIFLRERMPNQVLFWNRAHLGELVWGSLYRNSDPQEWVLRMEPKFGIDHDNEVFLIYLKADPEFIVTQDDGNSYSADVEKKRSEIEAFDRAVENSKIKNKLIIKVNEGDQYRSFEELSNQIRSFVCL